MPAWNRSAAAAQDRAGQPVYPIQPKDRAQKGWRLEYLNSAANLPP